MSGPPASVGYMAIWSVIGSLFPRARRRNAGKARSYSGFEEAARATADSRGDKVTAMPPDDTPSAIDNVSAAAKDYGLSRFSGESDALAQASGSYRAAKKRRRRGKG